MSDVLRAPSPTVMRALPRRIRSRGRRCNVDVPEPLAESLARYFELLWSWNAKINLTGISTADEAIDRLLIEPVAAVRYLRNQMRSLVDVGSGGGSPAIPLKLARPSFSVRMIEAKVRKSAFLREVSRRLELEDVVVETARYEALLARPELHEEADLITVRAVRVDQRFLMGVQAFLKPGGLIALFRSAGSGEIRDLPPPLSVEATEPLVPALGSHLHLIRKMPLGAK